MRTVTYNTMKIDDETFEPAEAREDYFTVIFEVAKENIAPFTKTLMQQYSQILGMLKKDIPA